MATRQRHLPALFILGGKQSLCTSNLPPQLLPSPMALWLAVLLLLRTPPCVGLDHLSRLYADLFEKYNADVIPMADDRQPLLIKSSFYLSSIREVNEKSQTITIKGWAKMLWVDARLMWDPSRYGNVTVINVANAKIWTPDVVSFNGVDGYFFDTIGYVKTRVSYDGVVEYEPGGQMTLQCPLFLRRFPFDSQVCSLELAPWSYLGDQINTVAVLIEIPKDDFTTNGEWDIIGLWMANSTYESDNGNFTKADFFFRVKRHPFFQLVTMLVPVVLLAFLNLFVFRLPAEDGEKINFACGLLLAYSVWLIQLIQSLPMNSGSIPLIGLYVIFLMMMAALSIVATVYVIRVHCKSDSEPIPRKLRTFCSRCQCPCRVTLCVVSRNAASVKPVELKSHEALTWKTVARQLDDLLFCVCSATVVTMSLVFGVCFAVIEDGDGLT